jgi:hypothetical protein
MKLIETTVTSGFARMLYADAPKEQAIEWIEFRVKYEGQDTLPLAAIQARALHRLQDVIDEETKRLQALQSQSRG